MTRSTGHLTDAEAQQLVDRALSSPEEARLERHAAACAECRATVETYRMLAGALAELDVPVPPTDFTEGVLARIDAHELAAARERRWALAIVGAVLAATLGAFAAAGSSAWAPELASAADRIGGALAAIHLGAGFLPAVVGALRLQIVVAAAVVALPFVIALARLIPAPRTEFV